MYGSYHVFKNLMWVHVMLFEIMYVHNIMFVHDMLVHMATLGFFLGRQLP